jgi:hypothetical protein
MPNKQNAARRHQIPKMKFRAKNWAEYDAGLRRRGSLTLWVTQPSTLLFKVTPRKEQPARWITFERPGCRWEVNRVLNGACF